MVRLDKVAVEVCKILGYVGIRLLKGFLIKWW